LGRNKQIETFVDAGTGGHSKYWGSANENAPNNSWERSILLAVDGNDKTLRVVMVDDVIPNVHPSAIRVL